MTFKAERTVRNALSVLYVTPSGLSMSMEGFTHPSDPACLLAPSSCGLIFPPFSVAPGSDFCSSTPHNDISGVAFNSLLLILGSVETGSSRLFKLCGKTLHRCGLLEKQSGSS